jgi:hypothetical protein
LPLGLPDLTAIYGQAEMGQCLLGQAKRGLLRPAEKLLGALHLLSAEGRTMGLRLVLLARAAVGDVSPHDDQRWLCALSLGRSERGIDRRQIVAVGDLLHMPTVGIEALVHLFSEGEIGGAVDRNAIVIIEIDQLAKL